jgi:hypothetical protein
MREITDEMRHLLRLRDALKLAVEESLWLGYECFASYLSEELAETEANINDLSEAD